MKTNRILVGAIIIIILAMISSIGNNNITGKPIASTDSSSTKIEIRPEAITAGQRIYIDVNPGPRGVNVRASVYQAEDNLRRGTTNRVCNSNYKCKEKTVFSFVTSTSWEPGVYYVKLYDYKIEEFVKEDFTIMEE